MAFAWTKDLETGNLQIDTEHQQLIQALNRLLSACASGKGREEVSNTMDFLIQYTHTHFSHEELLQIQSKYPDYVNHKKYHAEFEKVVNELSDRLHKDGPSLQLVGEINLRMGDWLVNHIKMEDRKVARNIQAQRK